MQISLSSFSVGFCPRLRMTVPVNEIDDSDNYVPQNSYWHFVHIQMVMFIDDLVSQGVFIVHFQMHWQINNKQKIFEFIISQMIEILPSPDIKRCVYLVPWLKYSHPHPCQTWWKHGWIPRYEHLWSCLLTRHCPVINNKF